MCQFCSIHFGRSKQGASGAWKQKEKVINTSTKKVTCEWNGIDRPRLPERDPTGPTQPTTALPRELMAWLVPKVTAGVGSHGTAGSITGDPPADTSWRWLWLFQGLRSIMSLFAPVRPCGWRTDADSQNFIRRRILSNLFKTFNRDLTWCNFSLRRTQTTKCKWPPPKDLPKKFDS